MIINITGPNGSGKSTLVRQLMALDKKCRELKGDDGKVIGYSMELDGNSIGIIGRYETPCGGCDTIATKQEVQQRVAHYARFHEHVVFEGIIVSTSFGSYNDWLEENFKDDYKFAILNTTVDQCIKNVLRRRNARKAKGDFNEENLRAKHAYIQRVKEKCENLEIPHVIFHYKTALEQLRELLS